MAARYDGRRLDGIVPKDAEKRSVVSSDFSSAASTASLLAPTSSLDAVGEHQAAQILGLSVKTLRNWRWQHIGPPFVKFGQRGPVRYILGELLAWRAEHRHG